MDTVIHFGLMVSVVLVGVCFLVWFIGEVTGSNGLSWPWPLQCLKECWTKRRKEKARKWIDWASDNQIGRQSQRLATLDRLLKVDKDYITGLDWDWYSSRLNKLEERLASLESRPVKGRGAKRRGRGKR